MQEIKLNIRLAFNIKEQNFKGPEWETFELDESGFSEMEKTFYKLGFIIKENQILFNHNIIGFVRTLELE